MVEIWLLSFAICVLATAWAEARDNDNDCF